VKEKLQFRTDLRKPKLGLLLVGWGGNNGTTLTAGLIANKNNITWRTRRGVQTPNYFGSLLLAATMNMGVGEDGQEVFVPFKDVLPIAEPDDFAIGGWDISGMNLSKAMDRAQVCRWKIEWSFYIL
jgi:myo-inositol-1-phosphate synthase